MQRTAIQQRPAAAPGVPQNRAELDAVLMRRHELSSQLQGISERRRDLFQQRQQAPGAASAADLEARIKSMDARSAVIERQIQQADEQVAAALERGVGAPGGEPSLLGGPPPGAGPAIAPPVFMTNAPPASAAQIGQVVGGGMAFQAATFLLLGFILYRYVIKRAKDQYTALSSQLANRFEQLQQAVDVVALEVERISEGQRYVTKVVNEKFPALGVGEAQQPAAIHKSPEPARRPDESR